MLRAEIKKIVFSFAYILFVVVMIGTYVTQMLPDEMIPYVEPEKNQEYYGTKEVEDPEIMMPAATENLICEYMTGYYVAYPMMFYKAVHLKEAEQERVLEIIYRLSGLTKTDLDNFTDFNWGGYYFGDDGNGNMVEQYQEASLPEYQFNQDVSYEEFKELMAEVDDLIGGGSSYAFDKLVENFSNVPITYEEAYEEYKQVVTEDNIGESYTRLYCDYMGIFIPLIAIFAAVAYWYMDKKAKVSSLVYSKSSSTLKIVLTRVAALIITCFPVLIATYIHMMIQVNSLYADININWIGAIKIMLLWMLPELLFVMVLAALITEVISPVVAIFVQIVWWYVVTSKGALVGDINRWSLVLRHNTLSEVATWANQYNLFVFNRVFYLGLAALLLVCLIVVFDKKREGKFKIEFKNIFRNYKKKSA